MFEIPGQHDVNSVVGSTSNMQRIKTRLQRQTTTQQQKISQGFDFLIDVEQTQATNSINAQLGRRRVTRTDFFNELRRYDRMASVHFGLPPLRGDDLPRIFDGIVRDPRSQIADDRGFNVNKRLHGASLK